MQTLDCMCFISYHIILKFKVLMKDAYVFCAMQTVFHIWHSSASIIMLLVQFNLNALHMLSFTMSSVLGYI